MTTPNQKEKPVSRRAEYFSKARSISGYVASKAIPGLAIFAATPLWVAMFGFAEYAIYSMTWAYTLLASSISSRWLAQGIIRNSGDGERDWRSFPVWPEMLSAGVAGVLAVGISTLTTVATDSLVAVPLIVGAAVLAISSTLYASEQAKYQSDLRSGAIATNEFLRTVGGVALSLGIGVANPNAGAAAIIIAFAVSTVVAWIVQLSRRPRRLRKNSNAQLVDIYWSYGWPMIIWSAATTAVLYADRPILVYGLGAERAGAYAVVSDLLIRGFSLVVFPLTMYYHPLIMRIRNNDGILSADAAARRALRGFIPYSLILAFGSVAAVTFLAEHVGIRVSLSVWCVSFIALGAAAWQVAQMAHKSLEIIDATVMMALSAICAGAVTIGSQLILVNFVEETGVAAGFLAGAVVYIVMAQILGLKIIRAVTRGGSHD